MTDPEPAAGGPVRSRSPIGVAFIAFIALGLTSGLLGLAWPSMQSRFGLPLDAVGAIYVASTATYLAVSLGIGRLMSRLGSGTTLLLGAILLTSAMFGTAAASVWTAVVLFSAVSGLGTGVIDAGLNLHVATHHTARQMSWLHACFGVGATAGPFVMTFVLGRRLGWQVGYAVAGAFLLIPATLIALTRRRWDDAGPGQAAKEPRERAGFVESGRSLAVWLGVATFAACVGLEIAAGQWAYTLLTRSRRMDEGLAGVLVGAHWAALTGGRILFGFVADRFGPDRLLRRLTPALVVATTLFWWNPHPAIGVAGLLAIGFVEAPIFPLLMAGTRRRVGPRHAENAVALQMFASGVASAALPGLVGTVGRHFGLEAMAGALALFSLVAFLCHAMTHFHASRSVIGSMDIKRSEAPQSS